jgi:hypothetical protein
VMMRDHTEGHSAINGVQGRRLMGRPLVVNEAVQKKGGKNGPKIGPPSSVAPTSSVERSPSESPVSPGRSTSRTPGSRPVNRGAGDAQVSKRNPRRSAGRNPRRST